MVNFLWKNATLTHINLTDCSLGSYGGSAFGKGLATNKTLMSINLSKNHITDDGIIEFG
jgi:Ran GTPase-activating protein (RanGAP) involved in mRNA processing and transport